MRAAALAATVVLALAGCGGGDGDGGGEPAQSERPAVTRNEADARLLRNAVDNYKRETARSIAAVRSGLTQGDYDDDLNNDVYDLRVAVYRFDQALRRIEFAPEAEGRANDILSTNSAAIAQLDPIIEANRWPADTEERVKRILDQIETNADAVDALVARL